MFILNHAVESMRGFDFGTTLATVLTILVLVIILAVVISLYRNHKVNKELLEIKKHEMDDRSKRG